MKAQIEATLTDAFLTHLETSAPAFAKRVKETEARYPDLFRELAEPMLGWAHDAIGDDWCSTLANGYVAVLIDTNRGQLEYEREQRYKASSYDEVFAQTYDDPNFMSYYHWGVYVTTFAWEHQLLLYDFFSRYFLAPLREAGFAGRLLDLGCGSGIWSCLSLLKLTGWSSTMVDISAKSIELTSKMLKCIGLENRTNLHQGDALTFQPEFPCDAAISCCLLEHLETPQKLLANLATALRGRRTAFVTAALTSADAGHIFEFRRESEVVKLAEDAGFRVVASFSSAPSTTPAKSLFLPRSMALVLQKRAGECW